jgi:hypothetical protein
MKRCRASCTRIVAPLCALLGFPAWAPAQPVDLERSTGGGWNMVWLPDPDDVAFLQFSEDLERWFYFPAIVHGTVEQQRWWMDSDGDKFFVRLRLATGYPGDAWDGDYDGDGLSNLFEVQMGLDPFSADSDGDGNPDTTGDDDGDGLITGNEDAFKKNPLWMDHPDVKLKARAAAF